MRTFDEIHAIAAARKGGTEALEAMLEKPKPPAEIAAIPEATWLATFSRGILSAGLNWKVVENKWPTIEPAFRGFDVDALAMMDDEWLDALLADPGVIRSGAKITAIRDNAIFLQGLRAQGGAGQVFADWPSTDFKGLLELLKTQGARLGGATGAYGLRYLGRDSYILSRDVVARLVTEGVVDKSPSSKRAMTAVQGAFNTWMAQSGRSLTEISRVLAFSN